MDESGVRIVSLVLHRSQAKGLARMVGVSRIHSE